jgi:hypothetical protein
MNQRFLMSYLESLLQIKHHAGEDIVKGKFILDSEEKILHATLTTDQNLWPAGHHLLKGGTSLTLMHHLELTEMQVLG